MSPHAAPRMRIGIVNDIPMVLEELQRITSKLGYETAWLATNGAEAVSMCADDTPDLVLMDLVLPDFDGAEATRRIMAQSPCAILIVTATVKGHRALVYKALSAGAMDAVKTPAVAGDMDGEFSTVEEFEDKLIKLSRIIGYSSTSVPAISRSGRDDFPLIAIGASTGGPRAVATVLKALPENLQATTIILVHVNKEFAPGMAKWLSDTTGKRVGLANEGDMPKAGEFRLASSDDHLVLTHAQRLYYVAEPRDNPFRPSVDVFFFSLVEHWRGTAFGVLLTGMGADGAKGLLAMRQHGWHTIAQDQESSVVYGMPKAAAKLDAASEILPLDAIGPALIERVRR